MAIEARCPKCDKLYKLKNELNGKSVKCSDADCRHVFVIKAVPKPKAAKVPEVDAETLAAQVFGDDPEATKPVAERQMPVECLQCNHKWTEPESKAGKNVVCPECRTRMKVPELKKVKAADWRDPNAGRRLAEKGPELPADLAAQEMKHADIESLKKAGAIEGPEIEPRPLRDWILLGVALLVVVGGAAGGVVWFLQSSKTGGESVLMAEAGKGIEELKDDTSPIPKDERRLMRAALHLAQGEFAARLETKEGSKEALAAFGNARKELEAAPNTQGERDALFAELALAHLAAGGTDEQAKEETRIRWSMQGAKAPPVGSAAIRTVQDELRQTLTKFADKGVDRGVRFATLVRLTKELTKKGQPNVLFEIATQGFDPADHLEAQSLMLLVSLRAGGDEAKIRVMADAVKAQLKADDNIPTPWPAVALFDKLGATDFKSNIPPPVEGNPLDRTQRQAFAALALSKGDPGKAASIAGGFGGIADRLPAMATVAELMDDPATLLDEATKLREVGKDFRFYLLRLVRVAADTAPDKAEAIAKLIPDDGLREFALADAARGKWVKSDKPATDGDLNLPTEPAKCRLGHAWAGMHFARHNAVVNRDKTVASDYDKWADGKLRGFGYAGLALGLQDK